MRVAKLDSKLVKAYKRLSGYYSLIHLALLLSVNLSKLLSFRLREGIFLKNWFVACLLQAKALGLQITPFIVACAYYSFNLLQSSAV